MVLLVKEPGKRRLVNTTLLSLPTDIATDLFRLPAQAVAVDYRGPQPRSPEEPALDAGKLSKEFPPARSLELLCDPVNTQGYPHPADVQMDMIPVETDLCYLHSCAGCCFQHQLFATIPELHNVEYIVAILGLEAHVSFDPENARATPNEFCHIHTPETLRSRETYR